MVSPGADGAAAVAVESRMFRALAVLRVVVLVHALVLNLIRRDNFDRPELAVLVLAAMAVWTAAAIWAYAAPGRRTWPLLVMDLAMAIAPLALTPYVKGPEWQATIPGFWVTGALLAWAVHWRWQGGVAAAVVISAMDLGIRTDADQGNYGNIFLLLLAGTIVGYLCESIQRMAAERDAAERAAAVAAERARLARAVHDGVLQVLALTQRRGAEPGGDGELGRLAGEQERALRTLIRQQDTLEPAGSVQVDLSGALEEYARSRPLRVTVVTPGRPVLLDGHRGHELLAAVGACLDNVEQHVGEDAPVWLLLEDGPDQVVVTVRDEGPGIAPDRLAAAQAEGRLGVAESIRGRVADLGGTADLVTAPGKGTEWEFTVPRTGERAG